MNVNLDDLNSTDPKVKYKAVKDILAIVKESPIELYPQIDKFIELLDSENNILRWTAIDVIGYLSSFDKDKKIDKLLDKLFGFLNAGKLITANHAIAALTNIASEKEEHREKITNELLKVQNYSYNTEECKNIALGKLIESLSTYFNKIDDKKAVIKFVMSQTNNSRNATAKKAEAFLKKHATYLTEN